MEGYAVILEKKARGRGMGFGGRPWAVRTFKLTEQNFEYYDGAKLKGVINTKGGKAFPLNPTDADGKEFPFQFNTTDGEQVILNGSSWAIRDKCIAVLNRSAVNPRWDNTEDNEKYKLEARLRELEHERLGAVTSGAAGAFGAGGADAAMKKAQEAQKAIAAENAKNAFKNAKIAAKRRLRDARANGDQRAMSEAAAEMIQGMVRVKQSRKRIEQQRVIKAQWIRDAHARKIQSKYRQRMAKKRIQKIKWEKGVIGRKLDRLTRMQGVVRMFYALKRMNRMRMGYPDLVVANIIDLQGYLKPAGTTPEPLAVASGMVLDLPANHVALNTIKGDVPPAVLKNSGHVTSTFTSPTTVFPVNNSAELIATAANRLDYLVLTIVDNASPSKKDLIGQVVIKLAQVRNLSVGKPITLTLPLGALKYDVKNANGDSIAVTTRIPTGTVTIQITRPLPSANMAGPVYKVSDNVIAMGAFKKRWFTLNKGMLTYYNSEFALEQPKGSIACSTITGIEDTTVDGKPAIKVTSKLQKGTPSVTWTLGFDEDSSKAIKRRWLRVLYRNAPQVTAPVEISGKQLRKQKSMQKPASPTSAAAPALGSAKN